MSYELERSRLINLVEEVQSDPDKSLEAISFAIEQFPELGVDPIIIFTRAEVHRRKGMSRVIAAMEADPYFVPSEHSSEEIRATSGITEDELDSIELAFKDFKEIKDKFPSAFESMDQEESRNFDLVNDLMGSVLEKCRPGELEEIFPGKLKLSYLGTDNIKVHPSVEKSAVEPFLEIPLTGKLYRSRSVLVMSSGSDYTGRKYIHVNFFKYPFSILDPGETLQRAEYNGSTYIFDDGSDDYQLPKPPEKVSEPKESSAPQKKGFLKRLFG